MKKMIITVSLCMVTLFALYAQETDEKSSFFTKKREITDDNSAIVNKRGISLLPQAEDIALGIEINPFLNYFGNMFNYSEGNEAPSFSGISNTLYLKYFLEQDIAVRAKLFLNFTQEKFKQTVTNQYAIITDPTNTAATTVDTRILNNQGIRLDLGYEIRRGHGRVQGFYGPEVSLGYFGGKDFYKYGNPITDANRNPEYHNFTGSNVNQGYRLTEVKTGGEFIAGLGGFVGVEYFFTPQISIGGELGLRFNYAIRGQDEITTEGWLDSTIKEYSYRERKDDVSAFFIGGSTITQGSIFILFHF